MLAARTPRADAATALLDRKLKLMEQLSCKALFAELEALDLSICELGAKQSRLDLDAQVAKAALEEAAIMATLDVKGGNETERKNNRTVALKNDRGYQEALTRVHDLEAQSAQVAADLDGAKRKARRVERRIDYQTAILAFLGG